MPADNAATTNDQARHDRIEWDLRNHKPEGPTGALLDEATEEFLGLGHWIIDNVPNGREQSVALTKLEEVSMWAKAGIARHQ